MKNFETVNAMHGERESAHDFPLNPAQRKAVTYDAEKPLLVLAGPGSGKTLVITKRIQYLTEKKRIAPERILVLTFTKDAAVSMRERFLHIQNDFKTVNFGTFHSVFYQILKQSNGLEEKKILTDAEKRAMMQSVLRRCLPNMSVVRGSAAASELLHAIGFYKNTEDRSGAIRMLPEEVKEAFPEILRAFEAARQQSGRLDFDDMLCDCRRMLQENASIRTYWQEHFSHILIDEFQDINPIQYEIIKLLAPPPGAVFAVGDDDQSIYGFRGSDPACMKRFLEDYGADRLLLDVNYRSTGDIVKASLLVIDENSDRFQKSLHAFCEEKGRILHGKSAGDRSVFVLKVSDREEEYAYLAEQCMKDAGCAVLFRTNKLMQRFALELQRKNIAYEMREPLLDPYQSEEAMDVMAYLRMAEGDFSSDTLLRVINRPARYVSREALAQFRGEGGTLEGLIGYYEKKDERIVERLRTLKGQLGKLGKMSPYLAVTYVRKAIGYEAWLKENRQKEGLSSAQEAMESLEWISKEAAGHRSLREWFAAQDTCRRMVEREKGRKSGEKENAVRLMTVHASKGLEFDTVYLADCNEKIFPYGQLLSEKEVEEERRLFYVGMTRAKKRLVMIYAAGSKENPSLPSRFLSPVLHRKQLD